MAQVQITPAGNTHLLFGEPRADADNVDDVPLDDPDVREVASAQRVEFLALPLPLLLLLRQALVAGAHERGEHTLMKQGHSLLLVDGLELDSLVGVLPPAGRAPPV